MCTCTQPSKKVLEDVVKVSIKGIQNIPIPVKKDLLPLIPSDFRTGNTLLVTTARKTLELPRKLANYLKVKYPKNFS